MNILLTGASGQLGRELLPVLSALGPTTVAVRDTGSTQWPQSVALDLADGPAVHAVLEQLKPTLIVNAAAYTAVDKAEDEVELATAVNADAPGIMGRWAAAHGARLLHYSTDYVFDGKSGRALREDDPVAPLNAYGRSKLQGEQQVLASGCRQLVLRTSWVYASHGQNFVLKMLELAKAGRPLSIVGDQRGCPTWARNLARYSGLAINTGLLQAPGAGRTLFHCVDRGAVSWFEFADIIFTQAVALGLLKQRPEMCEVSTGHFKQKAQRPACSILDSSALQAQSGIMPASLNAAIKSCLEEVHRHESK
jgi:dTDP-4-dehydrorhamnose reductase